MLRVDAGTHIFELGNLANYRPSQRKVRVQDTSVLEYLASAEERNWFKNLPTTFELPRGTIDRLRDVGRRLLAEDPKFQELMKALSGCLPASGRAC